MEDHKRKMRVKASSVTKQSLISHLCLQLGEDFLACIENIRGLPRDQDGEAVVLDLAHFHSASCTLHHFTDDVRLRTFTSKGSFIRTKLTLLHWHMEDLWRGGGRYRREGGGGGGGGQGRMATIFYELIKPSNHLKIFYINPQLDHKCSKQTQYCLLPLVGELCIIS